MLGIGAKPCQAQTVEDELKEIQDSFYFRGHPISPKILYRFGDDTDGLKAGKIIDLDLINPKQNSYKNVNNAFGFKIYYQDTSPYAHPDYFSYNYIGKTETGVYVVTTDYDGGGSTGPERELLFFRFEIRKGKNGKADQLLMILKKVYEVTDCGIPREVSVNKNQVKIHLVMCKDAGMDRYREWDKIISFEPKKPKTGK